MCSWCATVIERFDRQSRIEPHSFSKQRPLQIQPEARLKFEAWLGSRLCGGEGEQK